MLPSRIATLGGDSFRDEFSVELDGSNDYINCGDAISSISDYPFSVTGWFKAGHGSDGMIFAINDRSPAYVYYKLLLRATGSPDPEGNLRLTARESGSVYGNAETSPNNANEFNDNTWHHFAAIFTNDTSRALYVDGNWRASNSTSVDFVASTDSFIIGANEADGDGSLSKHFAGKISDIALYSSALSRSQITSIYNDREPYNHKEGVASRTLIGWWKMGDGLEKSFINNLTHSELITTVKDKNMDSSNNWDVSSSNWSIDGNSLDYDGSGGESAALDQTYPAFVGNRSYEIKFNTSANATKITIKDGGGSNTLVAEASYSSGTNTVYFTAPTTTDGLMITAAADSAAFDIDWINVKEQHIYDMSKNSNNGIMVNMAGDDFKGDTP